MYSNWLLLLIFNNLCETVRAIEIVFDLDYPKVMTDFHAFLQFQILLFSIFTLMEILMIKFWLKFIRQRVVVMKEDFIVICLTVQNLMMSSLYSIVKVILGDGDRSWGISLRVEQSANTKKLELGYQ